jgi:hypothetical protein
MTTCPICTRPVHVATEDYTAELAHTECLARRERDRRATRAASAAAWRRACSYRVPPFHLRPRPRED